jgi:3-hydroxyisobutyrate dehydrogenase
MKVAFLGLGRMGTPMAAHVVRADHDVTVWNRTTGKAGDLVELGATEAKTIASAVAGADVVILVLFGPAAVRAVLSDVLDHAAGALVLDCSTIGPDAAHEFAKACSARGLRYVDAPVAGSVQPATEGTLGVFLGGAPEDVAVARTFAELWGDPARIVHVGGVGSASALKLCVNQSLGVIAAGLGESLRLGRDLGLPQQVLLDVLSTTAYGAYLGTKRPMIEADDFTATAFSVDLLAKDLDLAVTSADSDLGVTRACLDQARRTLAAGHSGEDYSSITGHLAGEGEAGGH